ncbi:hypothetical protein [Bosea thiooxidans]|uniref:hypothetical protein n=1 Tax=Bosea thiooxidans TaxID=53254 RepID=UPI0009A8A12C|nr:hypothetical protein [Bosea thiooxidans]
MEIVIQPLAHDLLQWAELLPILEGNPGTYFQTRWPYAELEKPPRPEVLPRHPTPDELSYNELKLASALNAGQRLDKKPSERVRAIAQFIKFGVAQVAQAERQRQYDRDRESLKTGMALAHDILAAAWADPDLKALARGQISDHLKKLEKLQRRAKMG